MWPIIKFSYVTFIYNNVKNLKNKARMQARIILSQFELKHII